MNPPMELYTPTQLDLQPPNLSGNYYPFSLK